MKYGEATMGQFEAVINKLGGMEGLKRFLGGELVVQVAKNILLSLVSTFTVPTTTKKFVACKHFVRDTSSNAKVKISAVWSNFSEWFLDKTEDPQAETALRYSDLKKPSLDRPIIEELGGEALAETTLTTIYTLMKLQNNGNPGPILTNGYANIFYVRKSDGELCTVDVYWCDDGWYVGASSVVDPSGWYDGYRVFSRLPAGEAGNSLES